MKNLPALKDLYDGDLELKGRQSDFNVLINQPPKASWIREHPFARGVKYIPIERIEYLLTALFIQWRVEVKEIKQVANSVVATVRLHYQNVVNDEWSYQDGVGAAPLQTDKGAGSIDINNLKSNAVMLAAPAAETYAVKDAAEKIGKIFGKDLNRKDEIIYDSIAGNIPDEKITIKQFGYAEELVRKSTLDDDSKESVYKELERQDLSKAEFEAIINNLQMNQPKTY